MIKTRSRLQFQRYVAVSVVTLLIYLNKIRRSLCQRYGPEGYGRSRGMDGHTLTSNKKICGGHDTEGINSIIRRNVGAFYRPFWKFNDNGINLSRSRFDVFSFNAY